MPSPRPPLVWLLEKEARELAVSRAWWMLLVVMGPLVGMSFAHAVQIYGEVSGLHGTAAGVGEALSPLVGVWAPTFSACELAAVFLLPFVAIRLVAGDRQSGALKLELQRGMPAFARIAAKAIILLAGWALAMLPTLLATLLWASYGGSLYGPELVTLAGGHLLNAGLTIGLAAAMSSFADHPSTAAILTLGVTVGTWVVNFFGAVQGGWWERASAYTPAAMVAEFQHGLVQLDTLLIALILILAGLSVAAIGTQLGASLSRRTYKSVGVVLLAALGIFACTFATATWDVTENRGNSFSLADEQALRNIHGRLRIEAHLAPEDPRRVDLENHALSKLRRLMPNLQVQYRSATTIGLFEQTDAGYGEIWYDLAGNRRMSRDTTTEGVLDTLYALSGIQPPKESEEKMFRGHPLAATARGAGVVFYCIWPGLILLGGALTRRRFH